MICADNGSLPCEQCLAGRPYLCLLEADPRVAAYVRSLECQLRTNCAVEIAELADQLEEQGGLNQLERFWNAKAAAWLRAKRERLLEANL